jgi:hypothetical protein
LKNHSAQSGFILYFSSIFSQKSSALASISLLIKFQETSRILKSQAQISKPRKDKVSFIGISVVSFFITSLFTICPIS